MGTSPTVASRQVGILVLDNDPHGASAIKQVLDSEGWRVRVVPDAKMLLSELKSADWSLAGAQLEKYVRQRHAGLRAVRNSEPPERHLALR